MKQIKPWHGVEYPKVDTISFGDINDISDLFSWDIKEQPIKQVKTRLICNNTLPQIKEPKIAILDFAVGILIGMFSVIGFGLLGIGIFQAITGKVLTFI